MRSTNSPASRARRKRILEKAKGFYGARSKQIRTASDAVDKAGSHAYKGRKLKKRDMRSLFITRISAAVKQYGTSYSKFINDLNKAEVRLNRKMLSQIAIFEPKVFEKIVKTVQA